MALLQRLNQEAGITVILVTHDLNIARHAQRAIHLFDGKIIKEEIIENPIRAEQAVAQEPVA